MEALEIRFNAIEWKRRKLEDLREQKALSEQEEIWAWDDFVCSNWNYSKEVKNDY